jgi:hypothetical protein
MGHTSTSLFGGREWPFLFFRLLAGPTTRGRRVVERKLRVKRYFIYLQLQLKDILRKLPLKISHGLEKPAPDLSRSWTLRIGGSAQVR